ncbi:MAG TPA: phage portal protein [Dongiaceae bacterium]|nr:phage portal protein [Dongiaceae bacterium]
MSFLKRLFSREAATGEGVSAPAAKAAAEGGTWSGGTFSLPSLAGSVRSLTGVTMNQVTALQVSTVFACVSIRAEDVARCTARLYRQLPDGDRAEISPKQHPIALLLKRPNDFQTWFQFVEQMELNCLLHQNAYAVKLYDRRGNIEEVIPINPAQVIMMAGPDGRLMYNVARLGLWEQAKLSDYGAVIAAEDIIHLRGLTLNTLLGYSRIQLAREAIGLAMAQEQQAARWIGNGARPSGILKTDKSLTDEGAKRLKSLWQSLVGGLINTGSTPVLENGLSWEKLGMDSVDMEFAQSRKDQILEICRFFRMPPHKVGMMDGVAKASLAQQDQDYVNNTIMPDLERWETSLERTFDLDLSDYEIDFDETQLARADVQTRYTNYRTGIMSGFLKQNEARKAENLKQDPDGDKLLVPSSMVPQGSDINGSADDGAGRPPAGQSEKV